MTLYKSNNNNYNNLISIITLWIYKITINEKMKKTIKDFTTSLNNRCLCMTCLT